MLGALPVYVPLWLLSGGNDIFAHQALVVLSFALVFSTTAVVVWDLTGSFAAGLVAGALGAFSPFRVHHLGASHLLGDYFLPLIPWLAYRTITGRGRWGVALAAVLVLQTFHSYYLGYAAFAVAAIVIAVQALSGARAVRLLPPVVGAGAIVVAVTLPYVRVAAAGAFAEATPELFALSSARFGNTGAWPALGVATATALYWRRGLRTGVDQSWIAAFILVAVVGHLLALGNASLAARTVLPGFLPVPEQVFAALQAIRASYRFNAMAAMALSALAGIGAAGVMRAHGRRSGESWVETLAATAAALAIVVVVAPRKISVEPIETQGSVPAVYRWLALQPPAPTVEIPFYDFEERPFDREVEARRMFLSTYHWQRLLNGYSGYVPRSYRPVSALVRALPDPRAVELLVRTTGVRHVVVHRSELTVEARRRWRDPNRRTGLRVVTVQGEAVVFGPQTHQASDLTDRLLRRDPDEEETLLGTPRQPVAPVARRGAVTLVSEPYTAYTGLTFDVIVKVENQSASVWPVLGVADTRLVQLVYRWERAGDVVMEHYSRLPYDLPPKASVTVSLDVRPPAVAGAAKLTIGVAQDGEWFDGTIANTTIAVVKPGSVVGP